jgi:hypothetical protein
MRKMNRNRRMNERSRQRKRRHRLKAAHGQADTRHTNIQMSKPTHDARENDTYKSETNGIRAKQRKERKHN